MKKIFFVCLMALGFVLQAQNSTNTQIPENSTLTVTVSGKSQGNVMLSEIIDVPILVSNDGYTVEKFLVVYLLDSGDIVERVVHGNMIRAHNVQSLQNNAKLYLEGIHVRGLDGSLWKLTTVPAFIVQF
jgi:hypothetical protein